MSGKSWRWWLFFDLHEWFCCSNSISEWNKCGVAIKCWKRDTLCSFTSLLAQGIACFFTNKLCVFCPSTFLSKNSIAKLKNLNFAWITSSTPSALKGSCTEKTLLYYPLRMPATMWYYEFWNNFSMVAAFTQMCRVPLDSACAHARHSCFVGTCFPASALKLNKGTFGYSNFAMGLPPHPKMVSVSSSHFQLICPKSWTETFIEPRIACDCMTRPCFKKHR